jgi:hypothetical protein
MRGHPVKPIGLDSPGLAWRLRKSQAAIRWEAYWIASQDAVKRGYQVKTVRLWPLSGEIADCPTVDEWLALASRCASLQAEMLTWVNGGVITDSRSIFDGTFGSLIRLYQLDIDSPYRELRYRTALTYSSYLASLTAMVGTRRLSDLTFRDFKRWHEGFRLPAQGSNKERPARAHGLMTMVRIVIGFGKLLEVPNCQRLSGLLSGMTFSLPKKRSEFLTADHVIAIRQEAHRRGLPSIAFAQALQFELMLRQKDVLGEWLPISEPGASDVVWHGQKWLHGLHWRDIDDDLVLRKVISKSLRGRRAVTTTGAGKIEEFDLRSYPMVMEEIGKTDPNLQGPLVICETTGRPWAQKTFQPIWREIADAVGVPRAVQNRDSRAGGITEATDASADFEAVRRHAGHSQQSMTARYSRTHVEIKNRVEKLRVESRRTVTERKNQTD